jgi:phenylacetic acid degradation operon negative regulatory protein
MNARRAIFEIYLDYVHYYGGSIRLRSLLGLGHELGLTTTAMRAALCRLCSQGWLQASSWEKQSFYALTEMGRERVEEAAPRIFAPHAEKWDGQWTMLTYSLPEKLRPHRDRLRRELIWLGFGPLLPSVWISPRPVAELTLRHLGQRQLGGFVHLFRARHVNSLAYGELVEKCWNLKTVQRQYVKFARHWEPAWHSFQDRFNAGHPPDESVCFASKMRLLHEYGKFLHIDPGLPSELLPAGWPGTTSWRVFRECHFLLAERALNFFERHFQGPPETQPQQKEGRQKALHNVYELAQLTYGG